MEFGAKWRDMDMHFTFGAFIVFGIEIFTLLARTLCDE